MGKNQSASNLTNVIQISSTGNVTFVSGSTTLMSISSSGAITTTGVISGSNALSASYAANADTLDGLNSTAFATTGAYSDTSGSLYTVSSSAYATSGSLSTASGSLSATSGSLSATSGSLSAASGSFNTRVSALEITGSALSSSLLTVSGSGYATSGSLSTASGSFDSRVATIESKYATTGSNTFIGTQVISGSILQSGSFTTTGTIIAQTINVQSVTSSVVYSSGSNVFGNSLGNSQTFTGSVLITGSLTIAGASSATSYSGVTIFGSTIACSPIGCFATSCATSFIGGTMSGTTIYGSTAVCSANGLLIGNGGATATTNYLPKFTGASTIGNSLIQDDGTTVSITRTAGDLELSLWAGSTTVAGNSILGLYAGTGLGNLVPYGTIKVIPETATNTRAANMVFSTRQGGGTLAESFRIFSSQNVGIGTGGTDSGYKLDVNGTGRFSGTITTNGEYRVDPASGDGILRIYTAGTERAAVRANATKFYIEVGTFGERLSINNSSGLLTYTGAATFACSVSIGGADQGYQLDVKRTSTGDSTFDTVANFYKASTHNTGLLLRLKNTIVDLAANNITGGGGPTAGMSFSVSSGGTISTALTLASSQAATFSSSVTTSNGIISNYGRINGRLFVTNEADYGDMVSTTGMVSIGYYPAGQEATIRSRNYTTATNTKLAFDASQFTFGGGNVGIGTATPNYANLVILNAAVNSGNDSALTIGRATSLPSSAADYGNIFLFSTDSYAADKGGTISFGSQYGSSGGETRMSGIFGGKENATDGNYSGYLSFYTRLSGNQPTERMRITSGGAVCLSSSIRATMYCVAPNGTNTIYTIVDSDQTFAGQWSWQAGAGSAGYGGSVVVYGHAHATRPGFISAGISSGSGGKFTVMSAGNGSGVDVFTVNTSGLSCFAGTVCAPCFATISDYRMKSNIRPIEGLSIIMNTKPYKFEYNYDCSTSFGMIAHELQDTLPEAVFGYKDGEVMQGVDYMKLLPITIKAIQEQQCTICSQASRISLLESCLGIS